jgi:hypothetical protein
MMIYDDAYMRAAGRARVLDTRTIVRAPHVHVLLFLQADGAVVRAVYSVCTVLQLRNGRHDLRPASVTFQCHVMSLVLSVDWPRALCVDRDATS